MKACNSCGSQYNDESMFCSKCGSELTDQNSTSGSTCANCGIKNNNGSNFCLNCGADLKTPQSQKFGENNPRRKDRNRKNRRQKNKVKSSIGFKDSRHARSPKFIWVIAAIIIGSVAIASSFDLIFHRYPEMSQSAVPEIPGTPAVEKQVYAEAAKFTCTCGKCDEPVSECTCEKAQEERGFIRNYIQDNKDMSKLPAAVGNQFGGRSL